MVGLTVTISVNGVKNIWSTSDQDTFTPRHHAGRKTEIFEKSRLLVVPAVAIGVLQVADDATRFAVAVDSHRVIPHFDDPQLAVGAPFEGDRVFDKRLARDHLDLESALDLNGFRGIAPGILADWISGDHRRLVPKSRAHTRSRRAARGGAA